MYKINFNHLYYFLTIADEGSIVKASKKLHITQPALSHQLKQLELDLGSQLFERKGRRLALNKKGVQVKEYAHKIFRQSEEMIQFLKTGSSKARSTIKIGVAPWIPSNHFYKFIKPIVFNKSIDVQVFEESINELQAKLQSGALDVVICDAPYSGRSSKIVGHFLLSEALVCVSSTKNVNSGRFPKNLANKRLISYSSQSLTKDYIDSFLLEKNIEIDTAGEFSNLDQIKYAVEKGRLVSFLPQSFVKQEIKDGKLKKLGELPEQTFSLWAITQTTISLESIVMDLIRKFKGN